MRGSVPKPCIPANELATLECFQFRDAKRYDCLRKCVDVSTASSLSPVPRLLNETGKQFQPTPDPEPALEKPHANPLFGQGVCSAAPFSIVAQINMTVRQTVSEYIDFVSE